MNRFTAFVILIFVAVVASAQQATSRFRQHADSISAGFGSSYDEFVADVNRQYEDFRDKVNNEFADFMEKVWPAYDLNKGIPKPIEKPVPPVVFDEKDEKDAIAIKDPIVVVIDTVAKPQPKPVAPIYENDRATGYSSFVFYGTPMKVRWGSLGNFKLRDTNEQACAEAFRQLSSAEYNNLIRDCLALRIQYHLCDWAYYKMIEALAWQACGKDTDEAVFAMGVLLNQSGYKIRFGREGQNGRLHLLVQTDSRPFDRMCVVIDMERYELLDGYQGSTLNIFNQAYPGEKELSFTIDNLPVLAPDLSDLRTIKGHSYSIVAQTQVNKNLLNFFADYPTSYTNDNFMTRWAYYANTPLSKEVKALLYPQLQERISGVDQRLAANMLLSWVQTGLEYEFDDKVWGRDRAFFGEESLYYPFCDCEDRAILFTHLVRDLMGLDALLVYYPGHLASAIAFTDDISGDYIMYGGRKFTVCDPTYIGAPVGRTMSKMDNATATVILLNQSK